MVANATMFSHLLPGFSCGTDTLQSSLKQIFRVSYLQVVPFCVHFHYIDKCVYMHHVIAFWVTKPNTKGKEKSNLYHPRSDNI